MRMIKDKTARALRPAISAAIFLLAAAVGATVVSMLGSRNPSVGDIIAFRASNIAAVEEGTRLAVHRPDHFDCVIDLGVVRQSGGSMVVETRIAGEGSDFRVHWAGVRTSADTGNCGSDADLIIDHQDLGVLALSAGGYGVGPKRG